MSVLRDGRFVSSDVRGGGRVAFSGYSRARFGSRTSANPIHRRLLRDHYRMRPQESAATQ